MKFLENSRLQAISSALSREYQNFRIDGQVESYSCKLAGNDKRLYKTMCNDGGLLPNTLQALSPPVSILTDRTSPQSFSRSSGGGDTGGYLCDMISTKTLFHLKTTLNAAFPNYDFSNAKSEEFSRQPGLEFVMQSVKSQLPSALVNDPTWQAEIWTVIDNEINLKECDIYSYSPDYDSDPYGEGGCIWSFSYSFFNKKLKRLVFFTCMASSLPIYNEEMDYDGSIQFSVDTNDW